MRMASSLPAATFIFLTPASNQFITRSSSLMNIPCELYRDCSSHSLEVTRSARTNVADVQPNNKMPSLTVLNGGDLSHYLSRCETNHLPSDAAPSQNSFTTSRLDILGLLGCKNPTGSPRRHKQRRGCLPALPHL